MSVVRPSSPTPTSGRAERVPRRAGGGLVLALLLAACGSDPGPLELATPDRAQFELEVYPVLLRDCGFHACHGSTKRFFQVVGPGRGRMLPETHPLDPATAAEIAHTYERARSMIDPENPERSLLLRKPLEIKAGGVGHEGVDDLGRNVYQSVLEPNYAALARWVLAPAAPPIQAAQPMMSP